MHSILSFVYKKLALPVSLKREETIYWRSKIIFVTVDDLDGERLKLDVIRSQVES